jgi:coenzyme F420-0:L-glutamate ligase/coenzyme F420-1:gamma-L-glutamate ligase
LGNFESSARLAYKFLAPSRESLYFPAKALGPTGLRHLEVIPVPGLPDVRAGDDLARLMLDALRKIQVILINDDIVVVKQKIVSKSEGRLVKLIDVSPGQRAKALAKRERKDPRLVELVLSEAVRVVRAGHGVIITETRHGFVCANSGVDQSNVGGGFAALLPLDPDKSARGIRRRLEAETSKRLAVIVTDTFGRPWRRGQTDVAIGCSGINPLVSYAGKKDAFGYELRVTEPAVVDEIAGAAELSIGKLARIPAAVVRGVAFVPGEQGVKSLVMPRERDLFR